MKNLGHTNGGIAELQWLSTSLVTNAGGDVGLVGRRRVFVLPAMAPMAWQ